MKYSRDPRPVWFTELLLVFALGFLLSTALWLGLWFFQTRPASAAALDEQETRLAACELQRDELQAQYSTVAEENQQLDGELRDAKLGWGRCIREKTQRGPAPSEPGTRAANQP